MPGKIKIEELLSLPDKEKRIIAEKLFKSLPENKSVSARITKEEKALLESRWTNYLAGKSKNFSSDQMHKMIFGNQ